MIVTSRIYWSLRCFLLRESSDTEGQDGHRKKMQRKFDMLVPTEEKGECEEFFVEVCWPCISEDVGQQVLRPRNMRFFICRMDMQKRLFMTGGFHQ